MRQTFNSWKCKGATKDNWAIRLLRPMDLQVLRQNQAPNQMFLFHLRVKP